MFVIAGLSGAGKGSIVDALIGSLPNLWLSRSWTTRPRRPSDRDDAYEFVDRSTFAATREAGGFIEWAEVFGELYGTPVPDPPPGHDVLLEIDVQGARQVKDRLPEAVVIFIEPPSRQAQEERLRGRGDDEAAIARRLAKADEEQAAGRAVADHVVVNDDLNRAVAEVAGILNEQRSRRAGRHGGTGIDFRRRSNG